MFSSRHLLYIQQFEFGWNLHRSVGFITIFLKFFHNTFQIKLFRMAPDLMIVKGNKKSDWTLEGGYKSNLLINDTYPQRVFGAGARAGLFALLRLNSTDAEYLCRGPIQGFKVLLHIPGEVPQVSKHYLRVPMKEEVLISVKPNMMTTSESLAGYKPWERQCFFDAERQLRFFKIYTQRNCELECLSNFMMAKCGCVKFSLPSNEPFLSTHMLITQFNMEF